MRQLWSAAFSEFQQNSLPLKTVLLFQRAKFKFFKKASSILVKLSAREHGNEKVQSVCSNCKHLFKLRQQNLASNNTFRSLPWVKH